MSLACSATPRKKFPPPTTMAIWISELLNVRQFRSDLVNAGSVDAKALVRGQCLAGQLEQNAFEDRSRASSVGDLVAVGVSATR